MVTIDDEAELANTQVRLKEQDEEYLQPFGQTKVDHLFVPAKTPVNAEQLKAFVEEHPEIIFDFIIVGQFYSR